MSDPMPFECRRLGYGKTRWTEWNLKSIRSRLVPSLLTVCQAAEMLCNPAQAYLFSRRSDYWMFYLVEQGNGSFQKNGAVFPFSEGDLVIVAPQETGGRFQIASPLLHLKRLSFLNSAGVQTLCASDVTGIALFHPSAPERMFEQHTEIMEALERGKSSGPEEVNRIVARAGFSFLYEVEHQCFNMNPADPVGTIYNAINTFPDKPYSIPDLAASCGLGVRTLQRKFRKQTGSTIQGLVAICRIGLARRLLQNTWLPVSEIAVRCCYRSTSLFFRAFREQTGMSPGEFRRKSESGKGFTDTSNLTSGLKTGQKGGIKPLSLRKKELLWLINEKRNITIRELAERLEINPSAVQKHIDSLKKENMLQRIGSRRSGTWKISRPETLRAES